MAGRKTNLTSSIYVTGNISAKHRDCWVRAIPEKPGLKSMEDEQLGLTTKACTRIRTNALNALNKANKEGRSKGWSHHASAKKTEIQNQLDKIESFYKLLNDECTRREKELEAPAEEPEIPEVITQDFSELEKRAAAHLSDEDLEAFNEAREVEKPSVGDTTAQIDCSLYALFKDVPMQEVFEFAKQGLEGSQNEGAVEELSRAVDEVAVLMEKLEELQGAAKVLQDRNKDLKEENSKLREADRQLKKENKKLKNASTEIQNMAKRLSSLT